MITSISSKKQKSFLRKSLKSKSNKKNIQKILKHQEKPQFFISEFQLQPSIKERSKESNKNKMKASLNIHNSNINISSSHINFLNEEKLIKDSDINSTFVFTGNNESYIDNNKIIENYLKEPPVKHLFECKSISTISPKETNEINSLKEPFTLNSSQTSLTSKTNNTNKNKEKNKNNKLMLLLKKINSSNIATNKLKEKKSNISNCGNKPSNAVIKKKLEKSEKYVKIKAKNKKNKIIYYILFLFVNILVYAYIIIHVFQPSVVDLFYDNDHDNYVYTTSLLSQDRNITTNK